MCLNADGVLHLHLLLHHRRLLVRDIELQLNMIIITIIIIPNVSNPPLAATPWSSTEQ